MASSGQNYKNHVRYDPAFHFTLIPACVLLIVTAGLQVKRHSEDPKTWWMLAIAVTLTWAAFKMRIYALRNQDRIIRLEETQRMSRLCPDVAARASELNSRQMTALRFCSDAELPVLAKKALDEKLSNAAIKQSIKDWRGDYSRI
jgi:hypothetical protein